jgi:hypothetical protein
MLEIVPYHPYKESIRKMAPATRLPLAAAPAAERRPFTLENRER